jgi:hypothetical protein
VEDGKKLVQALQIIANHSKYKKKNKLLYITRKRGGIYIVAFNSC